MVNPVHVNRTFADRRLTTGGSDWLWVVTIVMGFSTLFALAFAKTVSLFLCMTRHALTGVRRTPATTWSTSVPLYGCSHPHSGYDIIFRHGIQFGTDACQD